MSSAKKKPLSFEEKRKRLSEIFLEKKDFFQLKELEKMGPKLKGIVAQTVKEVLKSLVDDELVICDKIGTSNYFWSFPSTALQSRKNKLTQLATEKGNLTKAIEALDESIEQSKIGKEESDERTIFLSEMSELESIKGRMLVELEKYKEMDPDLFDEKKKKTKLAKDAVNRWTDNIFTLQSYASTNFMMPKEDFDRNFEIPADLDYIQ